jgi:hypothetical protein
LYPHKTVNEKENLRSQHLFHVDIQVPAAAGVQPVPADRDSAGLALAGKAACIAVQPELSEYGAAGNKVCLIIAAISLYFSPRHYKKC